MSGLVKDLDNFETMKKASEDLLYEGCSKEFTVLCTVLELMKLKAAYGWLDASFMDLLELLTDVLSKPNSFLKSTYFACGEDSCMPKSLHPVSWSSQRRYELSKVQMQSV